jgi:hypothetical protein
MARVDELRAKVLGETERWKETVAAVKAQIKEQEESIEWLGERFAEALAPLAADEVDGKPLCVLEVLPDEPIAVQRDGVVCELHPKRIVIELGRKRFSFTADISDTGEVKALRSNLHDAPWFVPDRYRVWSIENKHSDLYVVSNDSLVTLLMMMYDIQ